jgi:hypothetical protein
MSASAGQLAKSRRSGTHPTRPARHPRGNLTPPPKVERSALGGRIDHLGGRPVLLDRFNRVLCAGPVGVALGPEDRFGVVDEIGDELASLVLPDFEAMRHGSPFRYGS